MRLPDDLRILHQPVRLGIMSSLHRHRRVRVRALRDALQVTDGNLATHLRALADGGYVRVERTWSRDGKQAFAQLTGAGADAIVRYAAAMRLWLGQIEDERREDRRGKEEG